VPTTVIGAHSITSSAQPSIRDFARNGVYGMPRACKLLRFDARKLDHPGPFLSFIGNKLAEVRGRTRKRRAAQIGKPRLDLGFDKTSINFLVESVDYLSGCLPGRGNAEPRACLEAGQEIADGWQVRQRAHRRDRGRESC
jgi:hypothetical protein